MAGAFAQAVGAVGATPLGTLSQLTSAVPKVLAGLTTSKVPLSALTGPRIHWVWVACR